MSFKYFDRPIGLQVELSTVCNALCLGCVRTDQESFSKIKATIPKNKYLDIQLLLQRISELSTPLSLIEFCGNIDEPTLHPDFLLLLEKLADQSPQMTVSIHTNGSTKDPSYFRELAILLNRFSNHRVRFSIDGLSDTHHIYRQNTSFEKIINNSKEFIANHGNAIWQMIIFPWNQHQLESAEIMAKELSFKQFLARKDRSITGKTYENFLRVSEHRRLGIKLESRPLVLEIPENSNYYPSHLMDRINLEIDCFFKKIELLFLSWDARLWPCCFMNNIYYEGQREKVDYYNRNFFENQPESFNSISKYSFMDILTKEPFKSILVKSWSTNLPPEKKIWRCVEKCSVKEEKKEMLKTTIL